MRSQGVPGNKQCPGNFTARSEYQYHTACRVKNEPLNVPRCARVLPVVDSGLRTGLVSCCFLGSDPAVHVRSISPSASVLESVSNTKIR